MDELERLSSSEAQAAEKHPIIIILDEVRSMQNVGAIFRTADAFGVEAIYLCGYTPTPPHRDIHKTALGATDTVAWQHFPDTIAAIKAAKDKGFSIYSVEQSQNSSSLETIAWAEQKAIALVFGNEVNGVSDAALAESETCIEIPQWGSKHSLNISVSVGVVLWEFVRNKAKNAGSLKND